MQFDIVICVGPNDNRIIEQMLPYTKKNIIGYRNIYLVCADPSIKIDGTITIDETIFPFTIQEFNNRYGSNKRHGWYLQQLLKLYSGYTIPGILKHYLVIDCDTHFLKPTQFISEDNKGIYTIGREYHGPYFNHMNKLHNTLKKSHSGSGIAHHMIFNNDMINELMELVKSYHNSKKHFWEIFIDSVEPSNYNKSGASEYEIYFNYMNIYHSNDIVIRQLNWKNCSHIRECDKDSDYVAIHWYLRKP